MGLGTGLLTASLIASFGYMSAVSELTKGTVDAPETERQEISLEEKFDRRNIEQTQEATATNSVDTSNKSVAPLAENPADMPQEGGQETVPEAAPAGENDPAAPEAAEAATDTPTEEELEAEALHGLKLKVVFAQKGTDEGIAKVLENAGIVADADDFVLFLKEKGVPYGFKAGAVYLEKGLSYTEIWEEITQQPPY